MGSSLNFYFFTVCIVHRSTGGSGGLARVGSGQVDLANSGRQSESELGRLSARGCQSESGYSDFPETGSQDELGPSNIFRDVPFFLDVPISGASRFFVTSRFSGRPDFRVSQSVSRSVSQSVSQSVSHSVSQSVSQSDSQSVSQSDSQLASQPVTQAVSQSVSHSLSRANSQSGN
eukprot:gene3181-biopygen11211